MRRGRDPRQRRGQRLRHGRRVRGARSSDLRVRKYGKPDGEVRADETLQYTMIVDNLGPSCAWRRRASRTSSSSNGLRSRSRAGRVTGRRRAHPIRWGQHDRQLVFDCTLDDGAGGAAGDRRPGEPGPLDHHGSTWWRCERSGHQQHGDGHEPVVRSGRVEQRGAHRARDHRGGRPDDGEGRARRRWWPVRRSSTR